VSLYTVKYATKIEIFKDFKKQSFYICLAPFLVDIMAMLERYQMDLRDSHDSGETE
jgi:hypothetical protein